MIFHFIVESHGTANVSTFCTKINQLKYSYKFSSRTTCIEFQAACPRMLQVIL